MLVFILSILTSAPTNLLCAKSICKGQKEFHDLHNLGVRPSVKYFAFIDIVTWLYIWNKSKILTILIYPIPYWASSCKSIRSCRVSCLSFWSTVWLSNDLLVSRSCHGWVGPIFYVLVDSKPRSEQLGWTIAPMLLFRSTLTKTSPGNVSKATSFPAGSWMVKPDRFAASNLTVVMYSKTWFLITRIHHIRKCSGSACLAANDTVLAHSAWCIFTACMIFTNVPRRFY